MACSASAAVLRKSLALGSAATACNECDGAGLQKPRCKFDSPPWLTIFDAFSPCVLSSPHSLPTITLRQLTKTSSGARRNGAERQKKPSKANKFTRNHSPAHRSHYLQA